MGFNANSCVSAQCDTYVCFRFIERNELPQSYKEQIVQWILDNTGGAVGASAPSTNVDPFTGGGAYIPGAACSFPQPGNQNNDSIYTNADPFTGGDVIDTLTVALSGLVQFDCQPASLLHHQCFSCEIFAWHMSKPYIPMAALG